jgi:hypothetical protein
MSTTHVGRCPILLAKLRREKATKPRVIDNLCWRVHANVNEPEDVRRANLLKDRATSTATCAVCVSLDCCYPTAADVVSDNPDMVCSTLTEAEQHSIAGLWCVAASSWTPLTG